MLRFLKLVMLAAAAVSLLSGCLAPRGDSPEAKRAAIQQMKADTLNYLYKERPTARDVIDKAAGHAVFSNINALYFIVRRAVAAMGWPSTVRLAAKPT